MTPTDTLTDETMPTPPPSPPPNRVLRRSRSGRVTGGVASGLGRYFDVDPVLFRVLFATAAFFGGAGILAYLLAWAAIPEDGTERGPIDGWIGRLRRHRVPPWVVVGVGGLVLWALAFSWWLPGPGFLPVLVAVLLVVVFGRREWQSESAVTPVEPVDLSKTGPTTPAPTRTWVDDARTWVAESAAAARARRRRARPVRLATVLVLAATLAALGVTDSISGIDLQWYFWAALGIVTVGLAVGSITRRTPWAVAWLILPAATGVLAFAGSHARLHDGIGQHDWTPTTAPHAQYRLAFGQGVLDLRSLPAQTTPRTIRVTMAAGQVQVLTAPGANVQVVANVHIGDVQSGVDDGRRGGVQLSHVLPPPAGARGARVTVLVHLAVGEVRVTRG